MQSRDLSYLLDILKASRLIQDFIEGVDKTTFELDVMRNSAVIRQLEIIGEATKRLSEEFKNPYSETPWRQIAGMRDILIHNYNEVDLNEVWNTVIFSIPELIQTIEIITKTA